MYSDTCQEGSELARVSDSGSILLTPPAATPGDAHGLGLRRIKGWTHGIQYDDGRIDDGTRPASCALEVCCRTSERGRPAASRRYPVGRHSTGPAVSLICRAGAPSRYFIRRRGTDRLELTQADDGDAEHPLLFVAEVDVLERYLVGLFADDIRKDIGLPLLDIPWGTGDLADDFELSDMCVAIGPSTGGWGPIAAAPDPTLSLLPWYCCRTISGGPSPTSSARSSTPAANHSCAKATTPRPTI